MRATAPTEIPMLANPFGHLVFEEYEMAEPIFGDLQFPKTPKHPSDWFFNEFPTEARKYGPPILEKHFSREDGLTHVAPIGLNEDFFAAILGNEKCGQFIFYAPEQRFYRFNPKAGYFEPVDDESLKLALSQQIIRCTRAVNSLVDKEVLFTKFREEPTLNVIIKRAKAALYKERDFFSPEAGNTRSPLLLPEDSARAFVEECMEEDQSSCITIKDCIKRYAEYSRIKNLPVIPRVRFTETMVNVVRRRFNRSLRSDLLLYGAASSRGFKGLKWKEPAA